MDTSMDTLRHFLANAPEDLRNVVLEWAATNKVAKASSMQYLFDTNEEFAAALGVDPMATAYLWTCFVEHGEAWREYRWRSRPPPGTRQREDIAIPLTPFSVRPAPWPTPKDPTRARKAVPPAASSAPPRAPEPMTADPQVMDEMWLLLRHLGARGSFHDEVQASLAHLEDYKRAWLKAFSDDDAKNMRNRWHHWTLWSDYCAAKAADPCDVNPGLLAGWLLSKADTTKTGAGQAYWALLWIAKHTGLRLPTSKILDPMVKVAPGHVPRQVTAFPLRVLYHFDLLSRSPNVYVAHAASNARLRCFTGLRPVHLQRSRILVKTAHMILGVCALDKNKKQGIRRPFLWVCSRTSLLADPGDDDFPRGIERPQDVFPMQDTQWLLWEWGPRGTDITTASEWLPRACRRMRQAELTLLQCPPLAMRPDQARKFWTRSARRALATAARRLKLGADELGALANWRAVLRTGSSADEVARSLASSMQVHYDEGRLLDSARAGQKVILGLRMVAASAGSVNLEWDDVDDHIPDGPTLDRATAGAGKGLLSAINDDRPLVPHIALAPPSPLPKARRRDEETSPGTATVAPLVWQAASPCAPASPTGPGTPGAPGSPDSTDSAPGSDKDTSDEGEEHPLVRWAALRWCKAQQKDGLLHVCVDEDGARPRMACGITLANACPDTGLSTALATGCRWHQRCLEASGRALRETIRQWEAS